MFDQGWELQDKLLWNIARTLPGFSLHLYLEGSNQKTRETEPRLFRTMRCLLKCSELEWEAI